MSPRARAASPTTGPAPRWGVALALAIVYVVWGSTYAGIRVALGGFPPLLLGGIRFLAAGMVMALVVEVARRPGLTRRQVREASIVGILLLSIGNGGVVWSEQYVDSGLAAVIVATVPLWMVGLDALHSRGERLSAGVFLSFLLGLVGVGLLTAGGIALGRDAGFWIGVACLLGGSLAWAVGSLYGRYAEKPASVARYTAVEMLAGGALLTLLGTVRGEWASFEPAAVLGPPLWGELYLIVFGSLVAFSAYVWLLRAAPPALVGTYAYVNPVVAILLGIVLFDERLDRWSTAGTAVILVSVVLTQVFRIRSGRGRRVAMPPSPDGRRRRRRPSPTAATMERSEASK